MPSSQSSDPIIDHNPPQGRRAKKKAKQTQRLATSHMMDSEPAPRMSRKRLEHMERMKRKEEDKVSKKRKKELARIASKKDRKDTVSDFYISHCNAIYDLMNSA